MTAMVDAMRNLLAGQPVGNDLWIAVAWCAGLLVRAYVWSMTICRRRFA